MNSKFVKKYSGQHCSGLSIKEQMDLEIECLQRLKEEPHFPKILQIQETSLVLTHEGTSLNRLREPVFVQNYQTQIKSICDALQRHGIVHLDLIGKNICISRTGILTLIDFNIACVDEVPKSSLVVERYNKFLDKGGYASFEKGMAHILETHACLRLLPKYQGL